MSTHTLHPEHNHAHGDNCGHTAVRHEDHVDYVHDGHLHHPHEGHVDEHAISESSSNPKACGTGHDCSGHESGHSHGSTCGHEGVPHGDHTDYLVDGHLHHAHDAHCDNHGALQKA
jgi:hypothetical protein